MTESGSSALIFWGITASPFQLKMQALADAAGIPWSRWPEQAGFWSALATSRRLRKARRTQGIERFPARVPELDEYPSVPLYWFDPRKPYYDSTGLALHLDALAGGKSGLLAEPGPTGFICRLIDDAFDEFGLYMAHHHRWITSAKTNRMGVNSAGELSGGRLPGFARSRLAGKLAVRQAGRCPYLFSVAPKGFDAGVAARITPQPREGFPETHTLLDTSWRRYLAAMERVLGQQSHLLGDRFTLADASAYGQLNMHYMDGRAYQLIEELAPRTYAWLQRIARGDHREDRGDIYLSDSLGELIEVIAQTHIALMRQNERAYRAYRDQGQQRFNQAAFERDEALYDGELIGLPFRSVVKTFQVASWREVCREWHTRQSSQQAALCQRFPAIQPALFDPA